MFFVKNVGVWRKIYILMSLISPCDFLCPICSWCVSCGKVLWEMSTFDIPTIIPRKRENESSERMKRMREFKDDVKVGESVSTPICL